MKPTKRQKLEAAGWKVGTVAELLELTPEEEAIVEIRVALSKSLKRMRQQEQLSQQKLAEKTNSSQSRVAKMEAADRSVSIDPPIWTKIILVAEGR